MYCRNGFITFVAFDTYKYSRILTVELELRLILVVLSRVQRDPCSLRLLNHRVFVRPRDGSRLPSSPPSACWSAGPARVRLSSGAQKQNSRIYTFAYIIVIPMGTLYPV